ncbi:QcrA and Rieske domain-containing protein [Acidisoma cellulosilyticum]|nr:Rieske (2Fe-2S) protein [Acidisoma cellulosilyticum]
MICSRRTLLQTSVGCAALAKSAHALNFGAPDWPAPGDTLSPVDQPKETLRTDAIQAGAPPMLVCPRKPDGQLRKSLFSQLLLLRLSPESAGPAAGQLRAFTAICSHAGCVVSSWIPGENFFLCPCHGSEYDPARDGAVVGGPAPAPLPHIPLKDVSGIIVIAGHFSARPGGRTGRTD